LNDDAKSPPEAAEEGNNRDYAYYIKILRHTAKHRLHEEAFQTLDYMKTDEVEATTHSFNMMLVSCIKKPEIIAKLITKINKSAVKPDLATVSILTDHYEQQEEYWRADEYNRLLISVLRDDFSDDTLRHSLLAYRQLKSVEMPSSTLLYTVIVNAYLDENQLRLAYDMVMEMAERNIKISLSTIDTIVTRCVDKGFTAQANKLLEILNGQNILTANETTLCDAAEVEATEKKMQEVLALDDYYAIRASTPAFPPPGTEAVEEEIAKPKVAEQTLSGHVDPEEFFGSAFDLEDDGEIENDFSFEQLRRKST